MPEIDAGVPVLVVTAQVVKNGFYDFTIIVEEDSLKVTCSQAKVDAQMYYRALMATLSRHESYQGPLVIELEVGGQREQLPAGRALICPCSNGTWFSVTVRLSSSDSDRIKALKLFKLAEPKHRSPNWSKEFDGESGALHERRFLVAPSAIAESVRRRVWGDAPDWSKSGLLVVAGETGCGKTTYLRAMIMLAMFGKLTAGKKDDRCPHLVTFEDPIEQPLFVDVDRVAAATSAFDYTPRQRFGGKQAPTLDTVLRDALRQTPAVVMVGEVRDEHSWRSVMAFAGTGHLIIVTTHAASVTECFSKVFTACKARTSADRAALAAKILGIVHLRPDSVMRARGCTATPLQKLKLTVPALWTNTAQAVSELVSDGLASLLPLNSEKASVGSIGRQCFLDEILRAVKKKGEIVLDPTSEASLRARALQWDLEGR
jgi:Tfp pilus assembly pilus retraction ATPase PilT